MEKEIRGTGRGGGGKPPPAASRRGRDDSRLVIPAWSPTPVGPEAHTPHHLKAGVSRGLPPSGSPLVQLRRELRALSKLMPERLGAFEIDWRFNPPAASHMGGVWERMVRSVKTCLQAVVGSQLLTDEVLLTVFAEMEHMVNSRPLTYVSSDPEALTPNRFLMGHASPHLAPGPTRDGDMCSRRRWKQSQAVAEHAW